MTTATFATVEVIEVGYSPPQGERADYQNRLVRMSAEKAYKPSAFRSVTLDTHSVHMSSGAPWLSSVERRIQDSILPDEYRHLLSSEWISEEVGHAALHFFGNFADLLPSEPHLYASNRGDLVAEFQVPTGAMTTIISSSETTIFAVSSNTPDEPVTVTVRRGSNRLAEELRGMKRLVTVPLHGPMGSPR